MGEPQYLTSPPLALAQTVFTLASPHTPSPARKSALSTLQHAIREDKMAPLYAYLAHPTTGILNRSGSASKASSPITSRGHTSAPPPQLLRRTSSLNAPSIVGVLGGKTDTSAPLPWDESLYAELKADNDKELATIQAAEDEAVEREGDSEVLTAQSKRAELYARIGDKDLALAAFEDLFTKTAILGTKIDIVLALIRIALFFDDKLLARTLIARCTTLVESGGDWDRRNRLKAYQGLHLLTIRAHALAAPLLLDSLSTFTSTELCAYSSLVVYATLAGTVSLARKDFKTKVVDAPEIRAIFGADNTSTHDRLPGLSTHNHTEDEAMADAQKITPTPVVNIAAITSGAASSSSDKPAAAAEPVIDFKPLATLIQSLYHGNYSAFFTSLAAVEQDFLVQDRYLYEHRGWFVREVRLRGYKQLLQSYRVVSVKSMADSFGVSAEWLDRFVNPISPSPIFISIPSPQSPLTLPLALLRMLIDMKTATWHPSSPPSVSAAPSTA